MRKSCYFLLNDCSRHSYHWHGGSKVKIWLLQTKIQADTCQSLVKGTFSVYYYPPNEDLEVNFSTWKFGIIITTMITNISMVYRPMREQKNIWTNSPSLHPLFSDDKLIMLLPKSCMNWLLGVVLMQNGSTVFYFILTSWKRPKCMLLLFFHLLAVVGQHPAITGRHLSLRSVWVKLTVMK